MDTYLVQRCKFRPNVKDEEIKGFDTLAECEYMGASEFEFGALPASLREIAGHLADYEIFKAQVYAKDGRGLMVLCRKADMAEVLEVLRKMVRNELRTKESPLLKKRLEGEDWVRTDLWMAFLGESNGPRLLLALERFWARVKPGK